MKESNDDFSEEQLHYSLKAGKLILLLDGFDEISYDKKQDYESEILSLSNKYPKSLIVISSRPDDCFGSWEEFYVFYTRPLDKNQAIDLISKINYDIETKNQFITALSKSLYEQHTEFLSNPLLLTIMLLTYEQFAGIPEKLHIFYEQAFDTLYYKHDALKSLYKRKSFSGIAIDEFKQLLSTFCMITYSKRKMSFTSKELNEYLIDALKVENSNLNHEIFKKDLLKTVCILQKDGLNYTFSHRSFQEFFTAKFISKSQTCVRQL